MLTEKLTALLEIIKASLVDGKISIAEAWAILWKIALVFGEVVHSTGDTLTADQGQAMIEETMAFYNTEIASIDIAFIPNWIEPAIDGTLGQVLRMLLTKALDSVSEK